MTRRWRGRTYIKRVVISSEDVADRKEWAAYVNAEIADKQIPRLQADLARYQAIIEQFTRSRKVPNADARLLREELAARLESIRKAEEANRLANRLAEQRICAARREIEKITESDRQAQGIFRSIFFGYTPSPDAVSRIARQRKIIQEAESALAKQPPSLQRLSEDEQAFVTAFDMARGLGNAIHQHEGAKKKLLRIKEAPQRAKEAEQKRKQAEQKRKQKEGLKAAIVAAFMARTRDLADEVKKQLVDQAVQCPRCPYCGGEYGDEPHADHIYPISRGGLSTLENMVLVCSGCNRKKSDKTLRDFIQLCKMDRSFIEMNLDRLGKAF